MNTLYILYAIIYIISILDTQLCAFANSSRHNIVHLTYPYFFFLPATLCLLSEIPKLYNLQDYTQISIAFPPATNGFLTAQNAKCSAVSPGALWAEYSYGGNYGYSGLGPSITNTSAAVSSTSTGVSKYAISACSVKDGSVQGNGFCPNFHFSSTTGMQTPSQYCPCISTASVDTCKTAGCFVQSSSSGSNTGSGGSSGSTTVSKNALQCSTFKVKDIGNCFCSAQLKSLIANAGSASFSTAISIMNDSNNPCHNFFLNYVAAVGINYVTILFSVVVNIWLKGVMKYFTSVESYSRLERMQASQVYKIFIVTYVNMAFVALVAFGSISGLPDVVKTMYIFQGPYSDFTTTWYAAMGAYFLFGFILQTIVPLLKILLPYLIIKPLLRAYFYPFIQ